MFSAFKVFLTTCFFAIAICLPTRNITVTVPDGFSNHGKADLLCLPTAWYQIFLFFAVNYGSHAATIRSKPGQTYYHTTRDVIFALLFPFSGVRRAFESFFRCSWPSEKSFVKAARAGALCIVVRNAEWRPTLEGRRIGETEVQPSHNGDDMETRSGEQGVQDLGDQNVVHEDVIAEQNTQGNTLHSSGLLEDSEESPTETGSEENESVSQASKSLSMTAFLPAKAHRSYRNIHGMCKLPQGYSLTWLPSNARIISDASDRSEDVKLCSSYIVPKAIVAIVQTIYASITLYRARGDQIQRYGYAAFGLTVLPYLIMSVMNLLAMLLLADYPTLYIVRSLELDEAVANGGQVDGAVGRLDQSIVEHDKFLQRGKIRCKLENLTRYVTANNEGKIASLIKEDYLSITHRHSCKEVSCQTPFSFQRVGTERWGPIVSTYSIPVVSYIFGAIPIAVIGIWTHFDPGRSTKAQRVWIMFWLVADIFNGPMVDELSGKRKYSSWVVLVIAIALCTVPAIGGFVVVGQMLRAYGMCIEISGFAS